MKIVSYNVNGIRSAVQKGLLAYIQHDAADVYCFQELKAHETDIPSSEFEALGYHCYWFPAQKKGYSGVGIISKFKPEKIQSGCGLSQADEEGRVMYIQLNDLYIINTYFPSGSSGDERQSYKMLFLESYLDWLLTNFQIKNDKILLAGDYNICHKPIDIHDPIGNKNSSGFLPEERAWMDSFFSSGFTDSFRQFHPEPHRYSWWSFRANARNNNKGWRIDYINSTAALTPKLIDADIHPDIKHSDHCPVSLTLDLQL